MYIHLTSFNVGKTSLGYFNIHSNEKNSDVVSKTCGPSPDQYVIQRVRESSPTSDYSLYFNLNINTTGEL